MASAVMMIKNDSFSKAFTFSQWFFHTHNSINSHCNGFRNNFPNFLNVNVADVSNKSNSSTQKKEQLTKIDRMRKKCSRFTFEV